MNGYAGTRTYMSPEMLTESYTSKSDMWSIGILFYVMITGCIPYSALKKEELNAQIIAGQIDQIPLQMVQPSPQAIDFLTSLLHIDTKQRMSAAEAL